MEPTETRRVFPCFDEPEMKAVFHVTIVHRLNTRALGNEEQSGENKQAPTVFIKDAVIKN